MLFLREDTELLICENVIAINKKDEDACININTIDIDFLTLDLENQGWKIDDGLYEKLIIEYNSRNDIESLLKRWR